MAVQFDLGLHQFVEEAPCALAIVDAQMRYLSVSRRWLEDYGLDGADIHGKSHYEVFPEVPERWREINRRALGGETISANEDEFVRSDGRRHWLRWEVKPWRTPQGSIGGLLMFSHDFTKRKETEIALAESEAFRRATIDACPVAVITIDAEGRIMSFSRAATETFGYSEAEMIGANVNCLMPEPDHSLHDLYIRRYLETGERRIIGQPRKIRALRKNGEIFPILLTIREFVDGKRVFVGFAEDITSQEVTDQHLAETQAQLQHAARLGALGEMATSIAHEINQPLTAAASLAGAASLIVRKSAIAAAGEAGALIDEAVSEIKRASEIIHQMREFAKKRKTAKSLHDINKIIEDASAIALIGVEGAVKVEFRLGEDVGAANIDRLQIQQVMTNLIRNAVDAMKDSPEKRLTISTARRTGRVEISVADTGCGIAGGMKSKIFEPFQTDKPEGLGVGLAITRSIVDAHQGEILILDNNPQGAVFQVNLPA